MAAETSVYVANRIGGAGNVVMFVFDAFPPVQIRGAKADEKYMSRVAHLAPPPDLPARLDIKGLGSKE